MIKRWIKMMHGRVTNGLLLVLVYMVLVQYIMYCTVIPGAYTTVTPRMRLPRGNCCMHARRDDAHSNESC